MKRVFSISFLLIVLFSASTFLRAQWTVEPQKILKNKPMSDSETVYILSGEDVYHREDCKLLTGPKSGMSLGLAKSRGLKPCPECMFEKPIFVPGYTWDFSFVSPKPSKALTYSDNSLEVLFIVNEKQIDFRIQNKTDSGIKINWDEISIISTGGRASKIIHSGIRLVDRNNPQAPTFVPPQANITDILVPSENIRYGMSSWITGNLFDGDPLVYNGKEFSIYFPLEIRGARKEYSYKFKINVTQVSLEDKK